jgi:ABC-type transport system involved in multi-copper enzyme maturation permease subunit
LRSPSGSWRTLLGKEWRELTASRAWWVMLVVMGPLVGFAFIGAVRTYSEASGFNGSAAGVGEAFSPLVGIWAPAFSACELAAVFLLPFVGIRLVSGDRQSGALKLELQHPMPALARVAAKVVVLIGGWMVASIPPLVAIVLWRLYGGSIYLPELATVFAGHLVNANLTIAMAVATASMTDHPSTAAIVTLSVTVGTWIVNFVAAVQGGLWERMARYTPTAMVAEFQHGLIRLDVVLAACSLAAAGIGLGAIWMRLGVPVGRRVVESAALTIATVGVVAVCAGATASWDMSESRRNSFPHADEIALAAIAQPISIEVHLAPEDPRRVDLEHRALSKLRRVRPDVEVRYVSATSIGLFEQTNAGYGEVWFDVGGRKAMTRSTTADALLETIYSLAGVVPSADEEPIFRGHPLATQPRGAALIFYVLWPALVTSLGIAKGRAPAARARGRREAPRSGAPERERAGVGPREQ